jgi:DNA-binding CsgD family transcriptional regulator
LDLLEREAQRAAVAGALTGALEGHGSSVFLVGEPGLGKTALLAECCKGAAGFAVAQATCSELEQSVPFGLLDRLFGALGAPVALTQPPNWPAAALGPAEARLQRYSSILGWLRGRAGLPVLLAVDDLHWADTDSIVMLDLLCRRLGGLAAVVVATLRPWPATALQHARGLVADAHGVLERLLPLSESACAVLLEDRLGAGLAPGFVERAKQASAGNPLLLREIADARLHGEDLLAGGAGRFGERVFLPRFAGVEASALRWAHAASVLGTRFWPHLVERLLEEPGGQAEADMEALWRNGLLRLLEDGKAEFVHPLFRQALYDDLSMGMRRGLHARAFHVLLAERAPPAEAAPHAVAAGLKAGPAAVAVVATAGRQALAAGAAATAAEHFQAAVELAGPAADPGMYFELTEAAMVAGNVALAQQSLADLLAREELGHPERVAALRAQARVLFAAGRYPEAKRRFEEASALAYPSSPQLAAEVLLDGAFVGHHFEGPREALRTVQRAAGILKGSASADEALRVVAATAEANLACIKGDPTGLDEVAAAAKARLLLESLQAAWAWDIVFAYALLAKAYERFDDCELIFASLANEARRKGAPVAYHTLAITHADVLWRLGQVAKARELVAEAAVVAELAPTLGPFAWVGLAHTCYEQADWVESAKWAARVEEAAGRIGGAPYLRLWLCFLECEEALRGGDVDRAVKAAERARLIADGSGVVEPCIVPWHGPAIEAYVVSGKVDQAGALAASLERICRPLPCHAPRAVAARGRGLVAWRSGDRAGAEEAFQVALGENRAVAMPLAEAETLLTYGRFLRCNGRLAEARGVLHQALVVLEGTGAGRLAGVAREELSLAGGRRSRAGGARPLTAMELRVARLAGEGLTNGQIARQLFISVKTVEHHLSSVYAKLGVASRRDLIHAAGAGEDLQRFPRS